MRIIVDSSPAKRAAQELVELISANKEQRHLVLLSGGSTSDLILCGFLPRALERVGPCDMQFGLVDERFSRNPHHTHSNAHAIEHEHTFTRFLSKRKIHFHVMLHGGDCTSEAMRYDAFLRARIREGWLVSAIFGVGANMHTAGILPNSPVASGHTTDYAVCYNSDDQFKKRITITPAFFRHISAAFVYATGAGKKHVIEQFKNATLSSLSQKELQNKPALNILHITHLIVVTDQSI